MEENKKGGKRKGAGRKKTNNPKITVPLYVERNKVLVFGSREKLQEKLYDFINGKLIQFAPVTPESYDAPKNSLATKDEVGQWAEPKSEEPIFNNYANFEKRIRACKDGKKLNAVLTEMQGAGFSFFQNRALKAIAEEVGKDFFYD